MQRRDAFISAAVLLICATLLAVFTDIELSLVRWVNCGPLASEEARESRVCR